jgi:hypothetical protein
MGVQCEIGKYYSKGRRRIEVKGEGEVNGKSVLSPFSVQEGEPFLLGPTFIWTKVCLPPFLFLLSPFSFRLPNSLLTAPSVPSLPWLQEITSVGFLLPDLTR